MPQGTKWIDVRRHLAVVFFSECFICEKSFHLSVLNQLNIDEFPVSSDWNTQLLPPYGSILCLILSKILSHHPRSRVIVTEVVVIVQNIVSSAKKLSHRPRSQCHCPRYCFIIQEVESSSQNQCRRPRYCFITQEVESSCQKSMSLSKILFHHPRSRTIVPEVGVIFQDIVSMSKKLSHRPEVGVIVQELVLIDEGLSLFIIFFCLIN